MIFATHLAVPMYWQLPILIVIISVVYSATKYDEWPAILHETFRWGIRMAGFLLAIAVVLYVLATFV
jgi:hypothetical protein